MVRHPRTRVTAASLRRNVAEAKRRFSDLLGRVAYGGETITMKGGVRALVYEPLDLIARLAALIPLPMTKMRRFFGVFAP